MPDLVSGASAFNNREEYYATQLVAEFYTDLFTNIFDSKRSQVCGLVGACCRANLGQEQNQ